MSSKYIMYIKKADTYNLNLYYNVVIYVVMKNICNFAYVVLCVNKKSFTIY